MKIAAAAALVALVVLMQAVPAAAYDFMQLPGSICHPTDPGGAAYNKSFHRMTNNSAAGMWVTCPIVRDGVSTLYGVTVYYDGSASLARLEKRTWNGSLTGFDPTSYSANGTSDAQIQWWSSPGYSATHYAHWAISIFLGANSKINGLYYYEP